MRGTEYLRPLVQHRELTKARSVFTPEMIGSQDLEQWREAALAVYQKNHFHAVAFNQLDPKTLAELGFEYQPQVIYIMQQPFPEIDSLSDTLVVNPHVTRLGSLQLDWNMSLESCGSVTDKDGTSPLMFVMRPKKVKVEAYIWHSGQAGLVKKQFQLVGDAASIMDHEEHHLSGHTALSYLPIRLLDFTDPAVWENIKRHFGEDVDFFPNDKRYLIKKNGQILVVNIRGEIVFRLA